MRAQAGCGASEGRLRPRVVLAEDHGPYREGMVRALQRDGRFQVVAVCVDGTQALHAIGRLRPDVALLDVRMPGLTGLEVLASVHAAPQLAATAVVLLSADERIEQLAREHGAAVGVPKHLPRKGILDAVAEAFALHAAAAVHPAAGSGAALAA